MPSKYERKTSADSGIGRPRAQDEVTSELLTTGLATVAQLAQLFETDAKTLPKRLRMVMPAGTRRGNKVYSIKQAAEYIVTPGYEIEEFIAQMSPQEMSPLLSKEFWNGQRARLEYEIKIGTHWPTEQVVEYLGELANVFRMSLLLLADDVNREQSLTDGQRKAILRISDNALTTFKKNVAEKLAEYHANRAPDRKPERRLPALVGDHDAADDGNILAAPDDPEEADDI